MIMTKTSKGCLDYPTVGLFGIYAAEPGGCHGSLPLLDVPQDLDEVFQAENVAWVWSVIGAALIPGALVRGVSKVDHPDVNFGEASGAAAGCRLRSLLRVRAARGTFRRLLPVVDDQEGAGVEAV